MLKANNFILPEDLQISGNNIPISNGLTIRNTNFMLKHALIKEITTIER